MLDTLNSDKLRAWIGRSERRVDRITAAPVRGLWALLNRDGDSPGAGDDVPPLWHWLYFTPVARQDQLGPDGHPSSGDFFPPVQLPQRMWAGGSLEFHHPLRVGEEVSRRSTIADLSVRKGRSGDLVFVTVRHEIENALGMAITELQNIVYRGRAKDATSAVAVEKPPTEETYCRDVAPDPVLLFRYSALTFNAHRIHYDRKFASDIEGYPALVVQGPLIATLLIELLHQRNPESMVRQFSFKAVHPLFDNDPFSLCFRADGRRAFTLWARRREGALAMLATATIA